MSYTLVDIVEEETVVKDVPANQLRTFAEQNIPECYRWCYDVNDAATGQFVQPLNDFLKEE